MQICTYWLCFGILVFFSKTVMIDKKFWILGTSMYLRTKEYSDNLICRRRRMTLKIPVPGRVWPMSKDTEVTPAVQRPFFYIRMVRWLSANTCRFHSSHFSYEPRLQEIVTLKHTHMSPIKVKITYIIITGCEEKATCHLRRIIQKRFQRKSVQLPQTPTFL
jgi:hypothetical protein